MKKEVQKTDNWEVQPFKDCIEKAVYTRKIQRKSFLEDGEFPIISQEAEYVNGYWNQSKDLFAVKRPLVIFGDHTKVLKYVDFDFVLGADGVKILIPKPFLDPKFFYYFLQSIDLKSLGYARHYKLLKEISVPIIPLEDQKEIVAKVDIFSNEIMKLNKIYNKKINDLDELKKAILKKAFEGKL